MNGFTRARALLAKLQADLGRPPKKRGEIPAMVEKIIVESGIKGTERQRYFRLLATCAIQGSEPLYNNYKPRKKARRQ